MDGEYKRTKEDLQLVKLDLLHSNYLFSQLITAPFC